MDLILLEDVDNLGGIGDLVNVKGGFARNFLLPKKYAVMASRKNKKALEHQQRVASFRLAQKRADDEATLKRLAGVKVRLARKVGEQDKLFGSVTSLDIETSLAEQGFNINRRKIELPDPIKALGEFEVPVKLRADLQATVKVEVVAE